MSTRATPTVTATIAASASLSGEVDLGGYELEAIHMPAAWTAAAITFVAASTSGGTFNPVHDDAGTEVSITTAASRAVPLGTVTKRLNGLRFIKVRSGTAATPVNQAAEAVITLALRAK